MLTSWLEESDHVDELVSVEGGTFADRQTLSYQLRGHNEDGPFIFEQQAYFTEREGRIDWIRVLCSGFRPRLSLSRAQIPRGSPSSSRKTSGASNPASRRSSPIGAACSPPSSSSSRPPGRSHLGLLRTHSRRISVPPGPPSSASRGS